MAQDPSGTPDPAQAMEAWLQLMTQAMRGTEEAQKAFAIMAQSPQAMAGFQRWLALFAPGMEAPATMPQPDAMIEWMETWQKAMGVVPRTRYLDLLEKSDALERRVRELEEINRQLRAMLEGQDLQAETAQTISELWGQMLESSIKTQAAWMETWVDGETPGESAETAAGEPGEEE